MIYHNSPLGLLSGLKAGGSRRIQFEVRNSHAIRRETAAALYFMHCFAVHINYGDISPLEIPAEALEEALVESDGDGGILQAIHVALLAGVMWKRYVLMSKKKRLIPRFDVHTAPCPGCCSQYAVSFMLVCVRPVPLHPTRTSAPLVLRSDAVKEDAWQLQVERKVQEHWLLTYPGHLYPWKIHRNDPRRAATSYARMSAADRVRVLKLLCDIRLDQDDIQVRSIWEASWMIRNAVVSSS